MTNTEIGNRIKYARALRDVTLDDIAKKVGVAKSTIQRYEAGKITTIKIPVVESIAIALNVNPAWIVGKSEDMELPSQKVPQIMQYYERLNDIGKHVATEQLKILSEVPRYLKSNANENTEKEVTEISNEIRPHFINANEARQYLCSQKFLAAFGGDIDGLTDSDALIIANKIYTNNQIM